MDELLPIVGVHLVQPQVLSFLICRVKMVAWLDLVRLCGFVAILSDALRAVERSSMNITDKLVRGIRECA